MKILEKLRKFIHRLSKHRLFVSVYDFKITEFGEAIADFGVILRVRCGVCDKRVVIRWNWDYKTMLEDYDHASLVKKVDEVSTRFVNNSLIKNI